MKWGELKAFQLRRDKHSNKKPKWKMKKVDISMLYYRSIICHVKATIKGFYTLTPIHSGNNRNYNYRISENNVPFSTVNILLRLVYSLVEFFFYSIQIPLFSEIMEFGTWNLVFTMSHRNLRTRTAPYTADTQTSVENNGIQNFV